MHTSSASVTSGGWPGPDRVNPREGMIWSVSSTYSAVRRVSRSANMTGSMVRTCVSTPILDTLHLQVTDPCGVSRHNSLASGESPGR